MKTKDIIGGGPHPYQKGGDEPHPYMKDGGQPVSKRPSATPFSFNDWLNHFRKGGSRLLILINKQTRTSNDVKVTIEDLIVGPDESLGPKQQILRGMVANKQVYNLPLGRPFQFTEEDDLLPRETVAGKVLDFWLTPGS